MSSIFQVFLGLSVQGYSENANVPIRFISNICKKAVYAECYSHKCSSTQKPRWSTVNISRNRGQSLLTGREDAQPKSPSSSCYGCVGVLPARNLHGATHLFIKIYVNMHHMTINLEIAHIFLVTKHAAYKVLVFLHSILTTISLFTNNIISTECISSFPSLIIFTDSNIR